MSNNTIRVGVDVGGTFTDVVLWDGNKFTQTKVATTENQADGVVAGIEKICDL
ncbi:MAG: N-methylhydantoinase A/acetone carboxylase, beta subunit, partial [Haloquadratum sp. J07HQX50]